MKSFKRFLMETSDPSKYGTPVIIHQGNSSLPPMKKPTKSDDPFKYGTPVLISQGEHSISPSEKKRKRNVKEDVNPHDLEGDHQRQKIVHPGLEEAAYGVYKNSNPHLGREPEEVGEELEKHHNVQNNPHFDTLFNYTKSSYDLNDHLYNTHVKGSSLYGDHTTEHVKGLHIGSMDAALDHHELHTPLTVFSGVKFHPGAAAAKDPNGRIFLPSYTSTSVDPSMAAGFAKWFQKGSTEQQSYSGETDQHVLKIHLKPGQKGVYMGSRSRHKSENEFIMPRRTSMQVHPVPEIHHYRNSEGGISRLHVWTAHPVDTKE